MSLKNETYFVYRPWSQGGSYEINSEEGRRIAEEQKRFNDANDDDDDDDEKPLVRSIWRRAQA